MTWGCVSVFVSAAALMAPEPRARVKVRALDRATDDRELLVAVAEQRDRQAFDALCRRFTPRLGAFLRARTRGEVEELVQEVMLTVWRKAGLYDPAKSAPTTWIFTIARNKAIDAARRRRPIPSADDPHFVERAGPSPAIAPDDHAANLQVRAQLADALDALPEEQAEVLRGVYIEALTLREVAERLRIPLGTAKSRVRLALGTLRKHFAREGIDHG